MNAPSDPTRHLLVKTIFLRAIDMTESDRRDFLQHSCGQDDQLRNEVESLLQHHHEQTIVGSLALTVPDSAMSAQGLQANGPVSSAGSASPKVFDPNQHESPAGSMSTGWLSIQLFGDPARRHLIWGLAVLILAGSGLFTHVFLKSTLQEVYREHMETLLEADVMALSIWITDHQEFVDTWAAQPETIALVRQLVATSDEMSTDELPMLWGQSPLRELVASFQPLQEKDDWVDMAVIDLRRRVIGAESPETLGLELNRRGQSQIADLLIRGVPTVAPPAAAGTWTYREGKSAPEADPGPVMWFGSAIRDEQGRIIAGIGLSMPARDGGLFSDILQLGQMGESGETYAFDENGILLSHSRFTDDLRELDLLTDTSGAENEMLHVVLRDPGGDMTRGFVPEASRSMMPLTYAVSQAIMRSREVLEETEAPLDETTSQKPSSFQIQSRVDPPYRDYRGVPVIGAWTWIGSFDFGVVTEVNAEEAYRPVKVVTWTFLVLFLLLSGSLVVNFISSYAVVRLRRRADEARILGQYRLKAKIGEGGMGQVYEARHEMLKRPTAIKLIHPNRVDAEALERFAREVRLTSKLTHPNTIEIYDFGRADDGTLYFAMEYVDGLTLSQLVDLIGPVPPERVVTILKQVAGSLCEAHDLDLIHRDIKPHNVMLCRRGGQDDVVKVLDFGLIKHLNSNDSQPLTQISRISGTPMYMAPERFTDPLNITPSCDIYALGALAYYLIAGRQIFPTDPRRDLYYDILHTIPVPPSEVLDKPVSPSLESLVLECLAKNPLQRPASMWVVLDRLEAVFDIPTWDRLAASRWWSAYRRNIGTFLTEVI